MAVAPIAAARAEDAQGVASSRMSYSRFLEYLDMGRVKKVWPATHWLSSMPFLKHLYLLVEQAVVLLFWCATLLLVRALHCVDIAIAYLTGPSTCGLVAAEITGGSRNAREPIQPLAWQSTREASMLVVECVLQFLWQQANLCCAGGPV